MPQFIKKSDSLGQNKFNIFSNFAQNSTKAANEEKIGKHQLTTEQDLEPATDRALMQEDAEVFREDQEKDAEENKEQEITVLQKIVNAGKRTLYDIWKYMSESSLFVLHKDSCLRRFLIQLTIKKYNSKKKTQKDEILSVIQNGGQDDDDSDEVYD